MSQNNGSTWTYHETVYEIIPTTEIANSHYFTFGEAGAWIDELRIAPAKARVTTYTYLPGVGMLSQMDPNGKVVYYNYDTMGRIKEILDNDRKVIESYEYQ